MKKFIITILFTLLSSSISHAIDTDLDGNDALDIEYGGTNSASTGAARASLGVQAADADLTIYAGITPSATAQSILVAANPSAIRTILSVPSIVEAQAADDDLTIYAGITPSAFIQSILDDADQPTFQATLKALFPVTQAATVANAGTLTPTAGYKEIDIALTCSDDPSAITLSETGAIANAVIRVTNVGANTCTFANAVNNFVHKGGGTTTLTLETDDSFIAQYQTDQWTVLVNNTSKQYFASLQVPIKTIDPVVGDPDSTTFTTAGTNLYGQRFIATATGAYAHSGVVAAGENWAIESQTATAVTLTVHASDTYWLNGVSCTAGKGLTSDSTVSAFVACQYQAANTVTCRGVSFTCTP